MATLQQLFDRTTQLTHEKATRSHILAIRPRKGSVRRVVLLVRSAEKYSNPAGHLVTILWPTIPDMRTVDPTGVKKTPTTTPVRVHCSCPAFKFTGPAYHSTQEKWRLPGKAREDRTPDDRDPTGVRIVCKHILRCTEELQRIDFLVLSQIFNIRGPQRHPRRAFYDEDSMDGGYLPDTLIQVKDVYNVVHLLEPTIRELTGMSEPDFKSTFLAVTQNNWESLFENLGIIPTVEDLING